MIIFILLWCSAMCFVNGSTTVRPEIDKTPTECKLQDGTIGTCTDQKYCAAAMTAKNVSTCHIDGPDQYVCCKNGLGKDLKKLRPFLFSDGDELNIVGGLKTVYKEFPYMAALGWESIFEDDSYDYKCRGVLISPKYVLTAAHCAVLNGLSPSVALVGGSNLTDSSVKPINVSKAITHPGYKQSESYDDIALLQLETNSFGYPIRIWRSYAIDNMNLTAIGYGHTQFAGVGSDSLLKTYLSVVLNDECAAYYSDEDALPKGVIIKQICAKDFKNGSDTCQGDSGGPLILYTKSKYGVTVPYVVGITSFGRACALDPPGVYTRVSEYIEWIESVIQTV